jgi:hypothetical protein
MLLPRTGFHVHVEVEDENLFAMKVICQNFVKFEAAMDLLMPLSRRGDENEYCKSNRNNPRLRNLNNVEVKNKIIQCNTHEQVMSGTDTFLRVCLRVLLMIFF